MAGIAKLLPLVLLAVACSVGPVTPASPAAVIDCQLPVYNWGGVTNGGNYSIVGQAGFISMASGKFTPDPAVTESGSYDWAYRRWLPVSMAQVLPDGSAYAFEKELADSYEIHVVQVAEGTEAVVYRMPYDNAYQILAFQPEGIYVYPIMHRSGLSGGLWLLDPLGHALKPVPASMGGTWQVIAGGAAWGGPGGAAGGSLMRLDLTNGALNTWFEHPVQGAVFEGFGYGVSVSGFDGSGRPLVEVFPPFDLQASPAPNPHPEMWLVKSPGQATRLSGLPLPSLNSIAGVTDAHGFWVVGRDGVYLYANGAFRKMAPLSPAPRNNYTLLGGCG